MRESRTFPPATSVAVFPTSWWQIPNLPLHVCNGTIWSNWHPIKAQFPHGTELTAIARKKNLLDAFAQAEHGQIPKLQWTEERARPKDPLGQILPWGSSVVVDQSKQILNGKVNVGFNYQRSSNYTRISGHIGCLRKKRCN
jgi:hypothetical protein